MNWHSDLLLAFEVFACVICFPQSHISTWLVFLWLSHTWKRIKGALFYIYSCVYFCKSALFVVMHNHGKDTVECGRGWGEEGRERGDRGEDGRGGREESARDPFSHWSSIECLIFNDLWSKLTQGTSKQQRFNLKEGSTGVKWTAALALEAVACRRRFSNFYFWGFVSKVGMERRLVSYANTSADVVDHVGFGVDPPVIANFFRLLSLEIGWIFTIARFFWPHTWKSKQFGILAVNTLTSRGFPLAVGR